MIYQLLIDAEHEGYAFVDTPEQAIAGLQACVNARPDSAGQPYEGEFRLITSADVWIRDLRKDPNDPAAYTRP